MSELGEQVGTPEEVLKVVQGQQMVGLAPLVALTEVVLGMALVRGLVVLRRHLRKQVKQVLLVLVSGTAGQLELPLGETDYPTTSKTMPPSENTRT